jgi:hypothetical protein
MNEYLSLHDGSGARSYSFYDSVHVVPIPADLVQKALPNGTWIRPQVQWDTLPDDKKEALRAIEQKMEATFEQYAREHDKDVVWILEPIDPRCIGKHDPYDLTVSASMSFMNSGRRGVSVALCVFDEPSVVASYAKELAKHESERVIKASKEHERDIQKRLQMRQEREKQAQAQREQFAADASANEEARQRQRNESDFNPETLQSHYQLLGVTENENDYEIKGTYRKLSIENHPDKGGDAKKMSMLTDAYDYIMRYRRPENLYIVQKYASENVRGNSGAPRFGGLPKKNKKANTKNPTVWAQGTCHYPPSVPRAKGGRWGKSGEGT